MWSLFEQVGTSVYSVTTCVLLSQLCHLGTTFVLHHMCFQFKCWPGPILLTCELWWGQSPSRSKATDWHLVLYSVRLKHLIRTTGESVGQNWGGVVHLGLVLHFIPDSFRRPTRLQGSPHSQLLPGSPGQCSPACPTPSSTYTCHRPIFSGLHGPY
jgi:hypothetical protein